MDVVKYRVVVSLNELVSLEAHRHMGLKGALYVRQEDGFGGNRLPGLDLFYIDDDVLYLPVLDQVFFSRHALTAVLGLGTELHHLVLRDGRSRIFRHPLDASAVFDLSRLIRESGRGKR